MPEGEYVNMRPYIPNKKVNEIDESSDTYDTIEWLINNVPFNNGNAGIFGISYPDFYSAMSLNDSHPALLAVSPQAHLQIGLLEKKCIITVRLHFLCLMFSFVYLVNSDLNLQLIGHQEKLYLQEILTIIFKI